jgi:uncharacterized protein YfaS (alpha-2-macroglobulin family)
MPLTIIATLLTLQIQGRVSPPPQLKHDIGIWVAKDIAPSQKIRLNINTRNIPDLQLTAQKVTDPIAWFLDDKHVTEPRANEVVGKWPMSMMNKGDRPTPFQTDRYYSKQINLPPLSPGLYKIIASGAGEAKWAVVNVTNLAIVTKQSNYRSLVWVTDAVKGNTLQGARVDEYRSHHLFNQLNTDNDGLAVFNEANVRGKFLITRDHDMAMLPSAGATEDGASRIHFQTDRPVYRPGQTVQFKAIVRTSKGAEWRAISNTPFAAEMRDPKDEALDKLNLKTNAVGTLSGSFDIPSEAATGPYSIVLKGDKIEGYATFTVAAYRKPEFKVDTAPAAKRYLAGDPIQFKIDTTYYFGAPLQQAQVHYVVRRSPLSYWSESDYDEMYYSGDGNLYARDAYGADEVVTEDTTQTDAKGNAIINIKTLPNRPDMTYSIALDVTDDSRRQVSASTSVPVYSAGIRLGMRSDMVYVALGKLIPVEVDVKDLDNHSTAAQVTLELIDHEWNEKTQKEEEILLAKTQLNVPSSGKALAKLPARAQGDLEIRATATDKTGRVARAFMDMYVAGPNSKGQKEHEAPQIQVRLDKRNYKPGDTVFANVSRNFKDTPILVTAEGEDIFAYAVLPSGAQSWSVNTLEKMSPNAYVTATGWAKGQIVGANALVPLPDPKRLLNVKAVPNKAEYKPGEQASYKITSTDQNGTPVSTEVALSVVDEAIYAVRGDSTPDIAKFYWGTREDRVFTNYSAPEEVSGGAYQRVNPAAPIRQRFEDTAFWEPSILTDDKGEAIVTFQMPDNLTSWRAIARGVTSSTQVGMGWSLVTASRPVMMRLATPRQMVVGDELSIISSINNRTATNRDFKTLIEPTNLSLAGQQSQLIGVGANAEGHLVYVFDASTLPENGMATILGTVEPPDKNPDYSDALKVGFPIIPKGVLKHEVDGGMFENHTDGKFDLPEDRVEPATVVQMTIWVGLKPVMESQAMRVVDEYRYGPTVAADQLLAADALNLSGNDKAVRESHAMLSRTENMNGWSWWDGGQSDPRVTEHILSVIARTDGTPYAVSKRMRQAAQSATMSNYDQSQLWDLKACLAASLALSNANNWKLKTDEVLRRGIKMSPYARLRLAEALAVRGETDDARKLVEGALTDAEIGPGSAKIPAGEGLNWIATDTETTAQAFLALHALHESDTLQSKLVRDLAQPEDSWMPCNDEAMVVLALNTYLQDHPEATDLSDLKGMFNGASVMFKPSKVKNAMSASIPRSALKTENAFTLERDGHGMAFYEIRADYYDPNLHTEETGIGVMRRLEKMSENGVWHPILDGDSITAGNPIRCTVLAWGQGAEQASRISEPIPAGFEYVQDDYSDDGVFEQVRDGSIEHYVMTSSEPIHFTYYLRPESTGTVTALPATAELLRDPTKRGQSDAATLRILK